MPFVQDTSKAPQALSLSKDATLLVQGAGI
jgi:hypothetical protein